MRRAIVAATACIGALMFVYSLHVLGLAQVQNTLARIGWSFTGILALSGAREVVRTLAWMRTVEGPVRLSFRDAFPARLAGEALSTLLPMGMLIGEPAKAEHVGDRLPFATAFSALVIELAFYGASLLLLFSAGFLALFPSSGVLLLIAMSLLAIPHVRRKVGELRSSAALQGGPAALGRPEGLRYERPPLILRCALKLGELRRLAAPVLGFASRHPARARRIAVLEAAYHVLGIAEVYLTLTLISPHPVAWTSAIVLETVNRAITMTFKVLPMRMGVDEASAAMFASRLDLGATTGLLLALVRKVRLLFWSAVGLAFLLMRTSRVPSMSSTRASRWSAVRL
jgi:hypothetical protein